jgi:hypothetical protein
MKTIYHNWKNIPQKILPKSMMPEGIEPSDRTLILLARLSRIEDDPQKATALLKREIDDRNTRLPESRRDTTVTNADISKVLASLEQPAPISDDSSSQRLSESTDGLDRYSTPPQLIGGLQIHHAPFQSREELDHMTSSQSVNGARRSSSEQSEPVQITRRRMHIKDAPRSVTSNSNHQPNLVRSSIPQKQALVVDHKTGDGSLRSRSFRSNTLNPESDHHALPTAVPDKAMMLAGVAGIPDRDLARATAPAIYEEIEDLPLTLVSSIPSSLQDFPLDFVNKYIGGNNESFTQARRAMRDKEIVSWTEMIRINPENQPLSPSKGCNGALIIVDGRAKSGEIGKIYPTLLKANVGYLQYIGHYKVVKRITIPVETWQAYTDDKKYSVAEEVENRKWGQAVLKSKGLSTNSADNREKRIADILGFFERHEEPCLRMNWTLLQFVSFEQEDYNTLLSALKDPEIDEDEIGEVDIEEDEIDEDVSPVASKVISRRMSVETSNQAVKNVVLHPDQLQSFRGGIETPNQRHSGDSHTLMPEPELHETSGDASRPAKITTEHTPTVASAPASNDSRSAFKVPASGRSTVPSSTNDSNDCASPEYLSPAGDNRWRIHASRSSRVMDLEPPAGKSYTPSTSIKRQYTEDEVNIYEASPPPRKAQQPSVSQVKVARAPSRTTQQILASFSNFSNAKRRRLDE